MADELAQATDKAAIVPIKNRFDMQLSLSR
jgi:hypothetical protein